MQLRRTFGDEADAIRSEAAGYRLDTEALPTDADLFEAELDAVTSDLIDRGCILAATPGATRDRPRNRTKRARGRGTTTGPFCSVSGRNSP